MLAAGNLSERLGGIGRLEICCSPGQEPNDLLLALLLNSQFPHYSAKGPLRIVHRLRCIGHARVLVRIKQPGFTSLVECQPHPDQRLSDCSAALGIYGHGDLIVALDASITVSYENPTNTPHSETR
jgi:hypothetical protein